MSTKTAIQKPSTAAVQLDASVIFKIANPTAGNGPVYGFTDTDADVLHISKAFAFPNSAQHENYDNFTKLKSNVRFTSDHAEAFKRAEDGVEFLGWYLTTKTAGRFLTTQLVDSLYHQTVKNSSTLLLVNNQFNTGNDLNLKAYRLNESFLKLYSNQEERFVTKNLQENKLNYDNLLVEVPVAVHSNSLASLSAARAPAHLATVAASANLVLNNKHESIGNAFDHLLDQIDDLNHDLNNFNYFQRNQTRETTKIKQWVKQQEAKGADTNWEKSGQFKLPYEPSRFENYVIGNSIRGTCADLYGECEAELLKASVVEKSL
ncbi:hypothetical protein BABINDRAFT_159647 [Babjeviella inositovora NRRL Y-12698]|uniref:MPN domain-containing protein n=1 Tax=Babjeviella inositovora NRRL Y-12698 TaxID=984486 RepID=A0A1E3R1D2_9ASCO|nr:uncharacterized protein BABINDRAFT_159647 [Babjeviella inositovora NRRL Y-12698]ODQ83207.1 hypothetical protein BABINDRAFT_159647 [Babjeviella inositovora NRRL Y-12698]